MAAGIYTVKVRDAIGCEAELHNIVVMAGGLRFEAIFTADTECLTGNGAVTVIISEGSPPYQFKIDNGTFTDNNTFNGLEAGQHQVVVQDAGSCALTFQLTVPRGQSGVSWLSQIKPIMESKCATSGCHNGISRANNFKNYSDVKLFADKVKLYTQNKSMPFEGSLSQNQIDLIGCWVDNGAPEN